MMMTPDMDGFVDTLAPPMATPDCGARDGAACAGESGSPELPAEFSLRPSLPAAAPGAARGGHGGGGDGCPLPRPGASDAIAAALSTLPAEEWPPVGRLHLQSDGLQSGGPHGLPSPPPSAAPPQLAFAHLSLDELTRLAESPEPLLGSCAAAPRLSAAAPAAAPATATSAAAAAIPVTAAAATSAADATDATELQMVLHRAADGRSSSRDLR